MVLISGSSLVRAESQPMHPIINQDQITSVMNHVYTLMMPDYKQVYKKHFDEIEWLEHHYVNHPEQGDAIIVEIAQEFSEIMSNKIGALADVMFDEIARSYGVPPISLEEKNNFCAIMMQILPTSMVQGLKKNAELKSSVYTEILAERSM
jgi:hypothetical protein